MKRYSFLLLLIAFLLPIRGALAAIDVFCHLDGAPAMAAEQAHQHDASHASHHDSRDADHDHSTGHHVPAQYDTCKYCAAVCSVPPVPPADPTLRGPASTGSERFPALDVSFPSRPLGGLERPPRSI